MTPADDRGLHELIAAAGSPALPEEQDEQALEVVLAAFNAAGAVDAEGSAWSAPSARRTRTPRQWAGVVARCATALCVMTGGSVAVADAGILPAPVQALAHTVFGGIGVPAPPTGSAPTGRAVGSPTAPSPTVSATARNTATPSPKATTATTTHPPTNPSTQATKLASLCGEVIDDGDDWRSTLSQPDLALLTGAAGGEARIEPYCDALLNPAPEVGDDSSALAAPSEQATAPHGNGNSNGGNGNANGGGNANANGAGGGSAHGTGGGDEDGNGDGG